MSKMLREVEVVTTYKEGATDPSVELSRKRSQYECSGDKVVIKLDYGGQRLLVEQGGEKLSEFIGPLDPTTMIVISGTDVKVVDSGKKFPFVLEGDAILLEVIQGVAATTLHAVPSHTAGQSLLRGLIPLPLDNTTEIVIEITPVP